MRPRSAQSSSAPARKSSATAAWTDETSSASLHASPVFHPSLARGYFPPSPCQFLEWPAALFHPDRFLKPVAASLPGPPRRVHTSVCGTNPRTPPSSGQRFHKKCWRWLYCPWAEGILNPRTETHHGGTEIQSPRCRIHAIPKGPEYRANRYAGNPSNSLRGQRMKSLLAAVLLIFPGYLFAQGRNTPPGTPGEMKNNLLQIER